MRRTPILIPWGSSMARLLLIFLLLPGTAWGAGPETVSEAELGRSQAVQDGGEIQVFLLTMDQGEEVWELFGHNALLIRNRTTGEELVWNWGLFNFEDVDFIPRFLRGTMRYTMGPAPPLPFLQAYQQAGRTVYSNEVHLTPEQARSLDEFVRWNYLPENRPYIYDYFRDNCSTRVRDALDGVLDGAIRDAFYAVDSGRSYRWYTRRLVQVTGWVDQGLSFLLGTRGDLPRTEWEAMFLPMELLESLETFQLEGPDGTSQPLLGPRQTVVEGTREAPPETPPGYSILWVLLAGMGAGIILLAGTRLPSGSRRQRWGLALLGGAWSLFAGALGLILLASWLTDHVFIQRNVNILYASPLAFPLALFLVLSALRQPWWEGHPRRVAGWLAILVAGGSILGVLLQLSPWVTQGNGEVVSVALPINLALAWALRPLPRSGSPDGRLENA